MKMESWKGGVDGVSSWISPQISLNLSNTFNAAAIRTELRSYMPASCCRRPYPIINEIGAAGGHSTVCVCSSFTAKTCRHSVSRCSRLKRVYFLCFKLQEKLSIELSKSSPLYAVYGIPLRDHPLMLLNPLITPD